MDFKNKIFTAHYLDFYDKKIERDCKILSFEGINVWVIWLDNLKVERYIIDRECELYFKSQEVNND